MLATPKWMQNDGTIPTREEDTFYLIFDTIHKQGQTCSKKQYCIQTLFELHKPYLNGIIQGKLARDFTVNGMLTTTYG